MLTGQIFFPDALSEHLYETVAAYAGRSTVRDTFNSKENIAQQATSASYAQLHEEPEFYLASLIVGVDPLATSSGFGLQSGDRPADPPTQNNG